MHIFQKLHAVHDGHEHVKQDGADFFFVPVKKLQTFQTVARFDDMVAILEEFRQNCPVHFHIVNNQQCLGSSARQSLGRVDDLRHENSFMAGLRSRHLDGSMPGACHLPGKHR